jgi:release factor glutamine methyltransferase
MAKLTAPAQSVLWALVGDAAADLAAAGVGSPRFDAEELAGWAFGVPRSQLRTLRELDAAGLGRFKAAVARRRGREPLQHITGVAAFRYVELAVGPGVFVPRPETEVVAGWAIDRAREVAADHGRPPLVVDLCTGSGAIALSVASEVPGSVVHAVELSDEALAWAARNLAGSGVALHGADARRALPELVGLVDVVVSNPPYIPADGQVRDPEVLEHDPGLALWGLGPDGLAVLGGVTARALELLRPGGWLVVEHADVQREAVVALLAAQRAASTKSAESAESAAGDQARWVDVTDHQDLAGRDRFATARKVVGQHPPAGGG